MNSISKSIKRSSNILSPSPLFDPVYDYPKVTSYFIYEMPLRWKDRNIRIKSLRYMGDTKKNFIITILQSRYCMNIKRHHKSNNIYFVVVPELFGFKQKCTDCYYYESPIIHINVEYFFIDVDDREKYKHKNIRQKFNIR